MVEVWTARDARLKPAPLVVVKRILPQFAGSGRSRLAWRRTWRAYRARADHLARRRAAGNADANADADGDAAVAARAGARATFAVTAALSLVALGLGLAIAGALVRGRAPILRPANVPRRRASGGRRSCPCRRRWR
jgi:hypothetical protein